MLEFNKLEKKYKTDPYFNQMVNMFRNLIEEYGFLPSEIREGLFFAQYVYEMNRAREYIRKEEDWILIEEAQQLMKKNFLDVKDLLDNGKLF